MMFPCDNHNHVTLVTTQDGSHSGAVTIYAFDRAFEGIDPLKGPSVREAEALSKGLLSMMAVPFGLSCLSYTPLQFYSLNFVALLETGMMGSGKTTVGKIMAREHLFIHSLIGSFHSSLPHAAPFKRNHGAPNHLVHITSRSHIPVPQVLDKTAILPP
ncbi:hypothetical protein DY000_02036753 [Brassica cretica]|uniref:Uncharacterized protein n=1 Tax=Brassica cretica TaxID=69181 RepID=A0ABQ7BKM1_BRACR|nr:hypothetical protein DY000_02036753 [Brassica cretica]